MQDGGITLADLEEVLKPMAKTSKFQVCHSAYTLQTMQSQPKAPSRAISVGGQAVLSGKATQAATAGPSRLGRAES